jgi:probable phosphoglycerate mutase
MGDLIILRHGETEWSRTGRHTGRTDVPLTAHGEEQARALAPAVSRLGTVRALVSPAKRARRTAELIGLPDAWTEIDPELWEWDYGGYEGRTTAEIRTERPGWFLWEDGVVPGDPDHPGETVDQVGERADAVLDRVRPILERDTVVLVAHGHLLRVLTARWLGLEPAGGRLFKLATGTMSALGTEHDRPVIASWNIPAETTSS